MEKDNVKGSDIDSSKLAYEQKITSLTNELNIMRGTLLSVINLFEREHNETKYLRMLNDCYKLLLSSYDDSNN